MGKSTKGQETQPWEQLLLRVDKREVCKNIGSWTARANALSPRQFMVFHKLDGFEISLPDMNEAAASVSGCTKRGVVPGTPPGMGFVHVASDKVYLYTTRPLNADEALELAREFCEKLIRMRQRRAAARAATEGSTTLRPANEKRDKQYANTTGRTGVG